MGLEVGEVWSILTARGAIGLDRRVDQNLGPRRIGAAKSADPRWPRVPNACSPSAARLMRSRAANTTATTIEMFRRECGMLQLGERLGKAARDDIADPRSGYRASIASTLFNWRQHTKCLRRRRLDAAESTGQ